MTTDLATQVKAVRGAAGWLDRSNRGKLVATGADRQVFLHNMLSNAIKDLAPGQGCRAELLDDRGHVVADMRVYAGAEDLLIDLEPGDAASIREKLEKFVIMDDVTFRDDTDGLALVTVSGPKAEEVVRHLDLPVPPPGRYTHVRGTREASDIHITRSRWTGTTDLDLYISVDAADGLRAGIAEAVTNLGGHEITPEAFEVLRVEAGVPAQATELHDRLPLEAQLEKDTEGVSLNKGCYLGQEILARIDARGHVNRLLVGLVLEGKEPPTRGAAIHADGKEVGKITSSAFSPTLDSAIALAYIRREVSTPGTALRVADTSAKVSALPFL